MSKSQESGTRPRPESLPPRNRRRSFALALFGLLAGSTLAGAGRVDAAPAQEGPAAASRPPTPLHFKKTLFLNTEYLERAAAPVDTGAATTRFARRYGIAREMARTILDVATAEGIDPELAFRLVRAESRFQARARGGGALGLLQLMPSTARTMDRSVNTEEELLEPRTNLRLGFRYLRQMIDRYEGDVRLGLLAYNRGELAVDRALRSGRDPENGYSHRVLGSKTSNPYRGEGVLLPAVRVTRTPEKGATPAAAAKKPTGSTPSSKAPKKTTRAKAG